MTKKANLHHLMFYDFDALLLLNEKICQCNIGQQCLLHGSIGAIDHGIPLNIDMTTASKVLFDCESAQSDGQLVDFGGYPMHYIYSPDRGTFLVKNLLSDEVLYKFNRVNSTIYDHKCVFHEDKTDRILYTDPKNIRFHSIRDQEGESFLVRLFDLDLGEVFEQAPEQNLSTRRGKPVPNYNELERTVIEEDYEDELDFYSTLAVNEKDGKVYIVIFDNNTGRFVKKFQVREEIKEVKQIILFSLQIIKHPLIGL